MFNKFIKKFVFIIVFAKQMSCLHQNSSVHIDTLAQNYLMAERNLWHLVRSSDVYTSNMSLSHVYDTHEEYLGRHFGETGIFDKLSKQPSLEERQHQRRNQQKSDWQRKMERHVFRIIDSIQYINITALNTYRFLNHRQYDNLPHLIDDILENVPNMVFTVRKYADFDFWAFIKNVNIY